MLFRFSDKGLLDHIIPMPKFAERTGGFVVTFKFAEPIGGKKIEKKFDLTIRQMEILKLLKEISLNGANIAERLSDHPSVRTIEKDLAKLEKAGMVNRTGKARAIVWSVVK